MYICMYILSCIYSRYRICYSVVVKVPSLLACKAHYPTCELIISAKLTGDNQGIWYKNLCIHGNIYPYSI